jgi:peptide/nickel transport system permease protein
MTTANTSPSSVSQTLPAVRRRRPIPRRLVVLAVPLVVIATVAIVGPYVVDYDPLATNLPDRLMGPGATLSDGSTSLLGTDQLGRSVGAQIVEGARISVLVGVATIVGAGLFGGILGVISGYFRGRLDTGLMRLADIQLAFPPILLAIFVAAVLGPSVINVILTLAITRWVVFARVARSSALTTRRREYVEAALVLGSPHRRILREDVAPAALPALTVIATVQFGFVVLAEASLSFLGLGTPPTTPSWGLIVASGRDYLDTAWWISTFPGIALAITVLCIGMFGDALRDFIDPNLRTT